MFPWEDMRDILLFFTFVWYMVLQLIKQLYHVLGLKY